MKTVLSFVVQFLKESQDQRINVSVLVIALVVLFLALGICIAISRKNKLYINPKSQEKVLQLNTENEVA